MGFLQQIFGNRNNELRNFIEEGAVIIDVRTPQEFNSGHIKGSKNIPMDQLQGRADEIKKMGKPVVTVCHSGRRSGTARSFLEAKGIKAVNGGAWAALNRIL